MTKKQIRLLELLCKQISSCTKCGLYKNGRASPRWTSDSKYLIIGEAPGYTEVRNNTPFVGAAGRVLTDILVDLEYHREDFAMINSVNCRPVDGMKNGKPTDNELILCQDWLRKFIKIVNPQKIICLGNYAKFFFTNSTYGVLKQRGNVYTARIDNMEFPYMITIHPAYCIYNEQGKDILTEDLKIFKNIEIQNSWFDEEEFNV
jgi:DNA polymerase